MNGYRSPRADPLWARLSHRGHIQENKKPRPLLRK
jgi:hypothetical protein